MTKNKKVIMGVLVLIVVMIGATTFAKSKQKTDLKDAKSMMSFIGRDFTGNDRAIVGDGDQKIRRGFKSHSTDFQDDIGCRFFLATYYNDVSGFTYLYNKSDAISNGSLSKYSDMLLDFRKNVLYLDDSVRESDLDPLILKMAGNKTIEQQSIGELYISAFTLENGDYIMMIVNRQLLDKINK